MKKPTAFDYVFASTAMALIGLLLIILCAGCGHQFFMAGTGTGFRAGGPEYGINYGDGFFATLVTRDAVHFKAELDSTTGFSYDPTSNSYKGIKSVEYSVGPQANGYSVDFAKENPEVAKAYYEALIKYYEAENPTPQPEPEPEPEPEIIKKTDYQDGEVVQNLPQDPEIIKNPDYPDGQ